jgi:hypothetical protein
MLSFADFSTPFTFRRNKSQKRSKQSFTLDDEHSKRWDTTIYLLYDEELFTLPLALTRFSGMYYTAWANMMAGATVSLAPILLIFLFTQQYFVRGVVLSGLKG